MIAHIFYKMLDQPIYTTDKKENMRLWREWAAKFNMESQYDRVEYLRIYTEAFKVYWAAQNPDK